MKNSFTLNYWILKVGNETVFKELFSFLHFSIIRLKTEIGFLKQALFNLPKKAYLCVCVCLKVQAFNS